MTQIETILTYAAIGAVYGTAGYAKNVAKGTKEFDPVHFGSTLVLGLIAGGVVASQGDEFDVGTFETTMAALIPVADQLLNGIVDSRLRSGDDPNAL